jgi:hypothetical protein
MKNYFEAYFEQGPLKISTTFRTQTQLDTENTYIANSTNRLTTLDVLLTVHLSIILVIGQLNSQILAL